MGGPGGKGTVINKGQPGRGLVGTGQGLQCLGRWEGPTVRDHLCGMEEAAENITEPGQSRRGGKWQSSVILDEAPWELPETTEGALIGVSRTCSFRRKHKLPMLH